MQETSGNSRQSRQRSQLIVALLQDPHVEKAAKSIGISPTTAWRISKTPEFQEEYRLARRDAFSHAFRRLQEAADAAVTTLLEIMKNPEAPETVRMQAAERVLNRAERSFEREDLEMRLQRLEEWASRRSAPENGNGPISNQ